MVFFFIEVYIAYFLLIRSNVRKSSNIDERFASFFLIKEKVCSTFYRQSKPWVENLFSFISCVIKMLYWERLLVLLFLLLDGGNTAPCTLPFRPILSSGLCLLSVVVFFPILFFLHVLTVYAIMLHQVILWKAIWVTYSPNFSVLDNTLFLSKTPSKSMMIDSHLPYLNAIMKIHPGSLKKIEQGCKGYWFHSCMLWFEECSSHQCVSTQIGDSDIYTRKSEVAPLKTWEDTTL